MSDGSIGPARASGRFLLRLPATLHARLQSEASARSLSLNEYCTRRLAVAGPTWLVEDGARDALDRSYALLGANLVAVVLYGSVARGDAAAGSDADLLIAVDDAVSLTRDLYRRWDEAPVSWAGRPVDPHFVRLPLNRRLELGAWCEAAIDGVVLFERDGAATRHLSAVRGDIAAGRIVRRSIHGQPYWMVAA